MESGPVVQPGMPSPSWAKERPVCKLSTKPPEGRGSESRPVHQSKCLAPNLLSSLSIKVICGSLKGKIARNVGRGLQVVFPRRLFRSSRSKPAHLSRETRWWQLDPLGPDLGNFLEVR